MDKKKALEGFLIKELKDKHHVVSFVKEWKELGVNVGDINVINILLERNEVLFSMISYYNFGLTNKFNEIKTILKGIK